jgi:hypothetical protein
VRAPPASDRSVAMAGLAQRHADLHLHAAHADRLIQVCSCMAPVDSFGVPQGLLAPSTSATEPRRASSSAHSAAAADAESDGGAEGCGDEDHPPTDEAARAAPGAHAKGRGGKRNNPNSEANRVFAAAANPNSFVLVRGKKENEFVLRMIKSLSADRQKVNPAPLCARQPGDAFHTSSLCQLIAHAVCCPLSHSLSPSLSRHFCGVSVVPNWATSRLCGRKSCTP